MNELTIRAPLDAALEIERWIEEESTGEMLVGSPTRFKAMIAMHKAIREAKSPVSEPKNRSERIAARVKEMREVADRKHKAELDIIKEWEDNAYEEGAPRC